MAQNKALLEAIRNDDAEAVAELLVKDPSLVDMRDANDVTPLLLALYQGHREAAGTIYKHKKVLDVFEAAAVGDVKQLEARLAEDPALVNAFAKDGFYPLGLAAFFGQPEAVKLLLKKGADVKAVAKNDMRVQSLHAAVAQRSLDSVKALLAAGADPNARQQGGFTPLLAAAAKGYLEIVKLLVINGADPNGTNDAGASPLTLAQARRHKDVIEFLVSKGATS
jgi:ankyrin repeat protein